MSTDLTPTEELFLEVLAGRWRTGESLWTFSSSRSIRRAANQLQARGLIWQKHGQVECTFQAGLTEKGKEAVLDPSYTPPIDARKSARTTCCFHPDVGPEYACAPCRTNNSARCVLLRDWP